MNVSYEGEASQTENPQGYDDELREALIAYCRLSPEAVEQIRETMRATNMGFVEAAVHAGLVTDKEAIETRDWVRANLERRDAGVVETALRRRGGAQSLTVRHTGIGKASNRLILAHDSDNPYGERIRALRTELLMLNDADRRASCLAILSPSPGEGRSQLAAELAIAFSQLGRRTLLVDADLRRPIQHLLFSIDVQWGLAQALAFGQPAQLFGVEGLPYLSILPAGPSPQSPSELLSGTRFANLIPRWRYGYEFIIIDTPPISQHTDAVSIAAICGSVVIVSRAQSTYYRAMREALRRLAPTQTRILGAVMNTF